MKKLKEKKQKTKVLSFTAPMTAEELAKTSPGDKGFLRDNRGDAVQTIILIIVGVVCACIVGSFVFSAIRSRMDTGEATMTQVAEMDQAMLESEFTKYDATEITGSQVINIIKKYEQQSTKIYVVVNNGRSETQYVYTSDFSSRTTVKAKDAKDKADLNTYINPSATFLGEVIRDGGDVDGGTTGTGTIIGLKFTKQ